MIPVAPTWAFFGAAIDAPADPHLAVGAHLRFQPGRRLGLPATPLFVRRLVLRRAEVHADRTDMLWRDSHGQILTEPFTVVAGNPVTGWLPPQASGVCSWLEVGVVSGTPVVEARISTPRGPAVLGARSQGRYALSAQRIEHIVITGDATVQGVRWLDVAASPLLAQATPWRTLSLPVAPAPRYAPTAGAVAEAWARVTAGAPRRASLIQVPSIAGPAVAPLTAASVDVARVQALAPALNALVHRLINDLSASQRQLAETASVVGITSATATTRLLGRVLQGMSDPGLARYLGLADVDPDIASAEPGSLVVYHALAGWQIDPGELGLWAALLGTSEQTIASFIADVPEASGHPFGAISSVWPLAALAVATSTIPPDPPAPPEALQTEDRGWKATPPPPDVRRVVGLPVTGLSPAASVALARQSGASWQSKNPLAAGSSGIRLPMVPTVKDADNGPGYGRFEDRDVGPGATSWRLAQADWFGRWSDWETATALEKARALPPSPVIELSYQLPADNGSELLSGTVRSVVVIPTAEMLPPGGHLLDRLELTYTYGAQPAVTVSYPLNALPAGATLAPVTPREPFARLIVDRAGPALARSESVEIKVSGRWKDVTGALSLEGPEIKMTVIDPRPPLAPALPTELLYSARPDVTGKSRFELAWLSPPKTRYRVYFTTEATALKFLELAGSGLAATIAAMPEGADRAGGFRDHAAALGYGAFECLSREPIVASAGSARFEHALSGSLEGLALYKVIAESDHGVVSDFASAPLVTVAVPNAGAPARPLLSVSARRDGPGVELRIQVPRSRATVHGWRVRRSISARMDPRQIRVVASGDLSDPRVLSTSIDDQRTELVLLDDHELTPWTVYQWSVEVQAGPPPGAPNNSFVPAGEWSPPAVPARFSRTPPPPPRPLSVVAARQNGQVAVTITLDPATPPLRGTARGPYVVELVRRTDAGREALTVRIDPAGPGVLAATDPSPSPLDTIYAARLVDPAGRASPFTAAAKV